MEHFAKHAPSDIQEAIKSLTEYAAEQLDGLNGCEGWGEVVISEVNGVGYDGFIPYQLGGFEASLYVCFDTDASYHLTKGMSEAAEIYQQHALEAFLSDKKLPADFDLWADENEALRDEYYEYECDWFSEGALLQFECWIEGKPYDESAPIGPVMMRVSVNYKDAPYFRSKYAEDIYQMNISIDALRIAIKQWPDDWQARIWRELLSRNAEGGKVASNG